MKKSTCGFALSFGFLATTAIAEQMIIVDGEEYALSSLTANCQSIANDPAAQIACFSALSRLMEEQSAGAQEPDVDVVETLNALRAVAEYQDNDSGLLITGADCNINVVYFGNYFHISRRNVSTIDLFSAEFDASKLQFDQISEVRGAQVPLLAGKMAPGASAVMRGGAQLDSTLDGFEPKSSRATLADFAAGIVGDLPVSEGQSFDFVLVHPERNDASAEIWTAFETFVETCRALPPSWSVQN